MSKTLGMRCVWGLCGMLASVLIHTPMTRADVSTDVSGSVLVFPKVLWTGSEGRDTIIQVTNTSNLPVIAECFYVNARQVQGRPLWQVTDFTLQLTKKHPTHWTASRGRRVNPLDSCFSRKNSNKSPYNHDCDGAGVDPGAIPPVPVGFIGELKCIEVDGQGLPAPTNSLKGEAVLRDPTGDVSKYNAVAIAANLENPPASILDGELKLDNTPTNDGEFNSCPRDILLNHFADGLDSPAVEEFIDSDCEGDCPIRTELTLVPCSQDFENLVPSQVTVSVDVTNEFEERTSTSFTVDCWYNKRLADIDAGQGRCSGDDSVCTSDEQCIEEKKGFCNKNSIFSPGLRGSSTFYTTFTPVEGGGVLAVAEEVHWIDPPTNGPGDAVGARAAWNPQQAGTRFDTIRDAEGIDAANESADTITIPSGF